VYTKGVHTFLSQWADRPDNISIESLVECDGFIGAINDVTSNLSDTISRFQYSKEYTNFKDRNQLTIIGQKIGDLLQNKPSGKVPSLPQIRRNGITLWIACEQNLISEKGRNKLSLTYHRLMD
jgi:hypothetical protein